MISFRKADLLDHIPQPTPSWQPPVREPQFGDAVIVHDPEEEDAWSHSFGGHIEDFLEEGKDGKPKRWIIKDQEDDLWGMTRDKFDLVKK